MLSIFKNKKNLILAYYFSWKICFIAASNSCLYHLCFLVYVSVLAENLLILMENYSIWWKSLMKWSIMPWQRMTVLGKGGICKFLIPGWVVSECWKSWPMSLQGRCHFFLKVLMIEGDSWWLEKDMYGHLQEGQKEDPGTAGWSV